MLDGYRIVSNTELNYSSKPGNLVLSTHIVLRSGAYRLKVTWPCFDG